MPSLPDRRTGRRSPQLPDSPAAATTSGALRTLAHPLRSRLMSALRERGAATATELAQALDTNTGATSYHLRTMAEAGLVTDTGGGTGRRRLWAPARDDLDLVPAVREDDADSEATLGWLERDWLRHLAERFSRWLDLAPSWPRSWRDTAAMRDTMVVVTPEQLNALQLEIAGVVDRYRRVGQGNPEARRVAAYQLYYPVDMDRPPKR